MRLGQAFEDKEVVRYYAYRPPYPAEVFDKLLEISPAHQSVLDLGCGTGKIARTLSRSFDRVTAVDPSDAMLTKGQSLVEDSSSNITWLRGLAESIHFERQPFDLVVAAASIHWMDQDIVFPRLIDVVTDNHVFAVVDGDGAFQPPWKSEWDDFSAYWIRELKDERDGPSAKYGSFHNFINRYRGFLNVSGETSVLSKPVTQSIKEFVLCQHSRYAFAPFKLGSRLERFDRELGSILEPYAVDGEITFHVRTQITWGSIRAIQDSSHDA